MFDLPIWIALTDEFCLDKIPTYMGAFGHFMMKPSTLLGNMIDTKEETDGEAPAESEKQPTKAGKKKNGQEIAVGQEV